MRMLEIYPATFNMMSEGFASWEKGFSAAKSSVCETSDWKASFSQNEKKKNLLCALAFFPTSN